MREWPVKRMKLKDLTPSTQNPRTISNKALQGLSESVKRFGLVEPIVWNRRTGHIVGGHQRYKILVAQGLEESDVIEVDMPESEEIALSVTLNNPHIRGDWAEDVSDLLDRINEGDDKLFKAVLMNDLAEQLRDADEESGLEK